VNTAVRSVIGEAFARSNVLQIANTVDATVITEHVFMVAFMVTMAINVTVQRIVFV
jgi:hypothetical protein